MGLLQKGKFDRTGKQIHREMMIRETIIFSLIAGVSLAGEGGFVGFPTYEKSGVAIYAQISGKGFDPNFPRKAKFLPAERLISKSDEFLQKAFGVDFNAPLNGVSLERCWGQDSEYVWCWVVSYFDPDFLDDIDSARLFFVYLSVSGDPIMRVERNRTKGEEKIPVEKIGTGR